MEVACPSLSNVSSLFGQGHDVMIVSNAGKCRTSGRAHSVDVSLKARIVFVIHAKMEVACPSLSNVSNLFGQGHDVMIVSNAGEC